MNQEFEQITSKMFWNPEYKNYDILWDQLDIAPVVQLKFGIKRKLFKLNKINTGKRSKLLYTNEYVELKGEWTNIGNYGSKLSLTLKNINKSSIRLARLVFPIENGLEKFLKYTSPDNISFLRNGYQSWSTSRSYKLKDKPLRPWLSLVSLTSSNMANLPSNTPGNFSSEMYSMISNLENDEGFLVGQCSKFNQFIYIRLIIKNKNQSYFEIVFDFGRKLILPDETISLDELILAKGQYIDVLRKYFTLISEEIKYKNPKKQIKGWSSWYIYYNKITPDKIIQNINFINAKKYNLDYIQIDDGYQTYVGDWLNLKPEFKDKMKYLADYIKDKGFKPGIWIAPFIADKNSVLVKENPDFLIRTEYGKPIVCGYNPVWEGKFYYGLDITNRSFEDYIREVIRTFVKDWGYEFLKLDFLFGACPRGGEHHNQRLSKAEILKYAMNVIREESGDKVILEGCGMPISPAVGLVDLMRVGPDTANYWVDWIGSFLQTGSMMGVRNSIRNFMVRSFMNKKLWVNDPDCMILRKNTNLTKEQYETQINSIIISGGVLFISEEFDKLPQEIIEKIPKILSLGEIAYNGEAFPLDFHERELPYLYFNTCGLLGIFNMQNKTTDMLIELKKYNILTKNIKRLKDVWTYETYSLIDNDKLFLKNLKPYQSKLFFLE